MKRLCSLVALVMFMTVFLLAVTLRVPGGVEGQAPAAAAGAYELVAPLGSVMAVVEEVFAKVPQQVKTASPKDYKAVRREGMFLAEMGNLFSRLKDHSSKMEWVDLAVALKAAGLAMAESAAKSDGENLKKSFEAAKDCCSKCHDKYRD